MDITDEHLVIWFFAAISLFVWWRWYARLLRVSSFISPFATRTVLLIAPVIAAGVLIAVLRILGASDVRYDPFYLLYFWLFGLAWVGLVLLLMPYLGLSVRDDVVDRRNPSAAVAIAGALLGLMFCFAGGNVGEGPGWLVVLFSAALATTGFVLVWFVFELLTGISYQITVERDFAAGMRLGVLLMVWGVISGRAVAGNWVSVESTFIDYLHFGYPVLIILVVAVLVEWVSHPTVERPHRAAIVYGIVPALLYILGLALIQNWLTWLYPIPR